MSDPCEPRTYMYLRKDFLNGLEFGCLAIADEIFAENLNISTKQIEVLKKTEEKNRSANIICEDGIHLHEFQRSNMDNEDQIW